MQICGPHGSWSSSCTTGRCALEFLQMGVAAFVWVGADPHAERVCRHAGLDVSMVKGDEESLASSLQSIRLSHPYAKWVIGFSDVCPSVKEPEFGHSRCNIRAHSSPCVDTWISLLRDKTDVALLIAIGFGGFLRTMEALTLQRFQITAHISFILLTTKTGKRTGETQSVIVDDPLLVSIINRLLCLLCPKNFLWQRSPILIGTNMLLNFQRSAQLACARCLSRITTEREKAIYILGVFPLMPISAVRALGVSLLLISKDFGGSCPCMVFLFCFCFWSPLHSFGFSCPWCLAISTDSCPQYLNLWAHVVYGESFLEFLILSRSW